MKHNPNTIASLFGFLWGLIPFSYWIIGSGTLSYISIFLLFIIIAFLFGIPKMPRLASTFSTIILLLISVSFLVEVHDQIRLTPYLAALAFLININILLAGISLNSTNAFLASFFRTTSLMAFVHMLLVQFDLVGNQFGRFLFFGNTHPNLGGEIYVVAVVAGAIAMRRLKFILYLIPMLVSAYFLQSRTAVIIIVLILLFKLFLEEGGIVNMRSVAVGGVLGAIAFAFILVFEQNRRWVLEKVLFADDKYRGANSGFLSGRDARWQDAWSSFTDRPFFGHGLNWYIDGVSLGAHSPFLYSLVYFGIFGLIFWIFFLLRFAIIARYNISVALLISPCFLMFVLNDRFLNSNSFPLLLYFIVIRLSQLRIKPALFPNRSPSYLTSIQASPWRASQ